jgi:uncharacterized protein (DUF433 family)
MGTDKATTAGSGRRELASCWEHCDNHEQSLTIALRELRMTAVLTSHIVLDESGVAWIDDTNVKVIEVVLDKLAHGSSPEEMHFQYPHLSLGQIHAALAYYHDHRAAFDEQIARDEADVRALRAAAGETPGRQKLRALGHLP